MIFNLLKSFFTIIIFLLYQPPTYSKVTDNKEFNQRYLSNYFSALVSYDNQNNKKALKFFNLSKPVLRKHNNYLEEYVFKIDELNERLDNLILDQSSNFIQNQNEDSEEDVFPTKVL